MPQPWTYRHASKEYRAFLDDVKAQMDLTSDNMAYTAVDGVLQCFRRRLTAQQGLDFANVLPSVLRAIFIAGWQLDAPHPWADRAELTAEARALRRDHNLTPENAIEATAFALRRCTRAQDLDRVLDTIGPEAQAFWHVEVDDPAILAQRII